MLFSYCKKSLQQQKRLSQIKKKIKKKKNKKQQHKQNKAK